MSLFTVLGATGFIGTHLVRHLRSEGHQVETPPRDAPHLRGRRLGHVVYGIGTTSNFLQDPHAAVEAHVNVLHRLLDGADFESWLYLSSARVYQGLAPGIVAREETPVAVSPSASALYDLTKLLGEALCHGLNRPDVRIARLSNVYGAGQPAHTFLGAVQKDLQARKTVRFLDGPRSCKDYISIQDTVQYLGKIAAQGKHQVYNVASGRAVSHQAIADTLRKLGYQVEFDGGAKDRIFPDVSVDRLSSEFGPARRDLLSDLPGLVSQK